MNSSILRKMLAIGLCLSSLGTGGCGLLLDGAYLVSNKRFDESVSERKPTGEVHTAVEYEAAVSADGQVHLRCEERERSVERATSVQKTFERRGSFESGTYIQTS